MQKYKDFVLDGFQRDALEAIRAGESVIVAAPTGCGKTLVAEYAIERALESGERVIYTAPIKALSNQKFRDFGAIYGERVGIMTGDVTINPTADAIIMTTEIFRNTIFDNPARLKGIKYVILDEAHYLDDPERGTVWEESIIFAPPEIRFIALSATISNLDQFAAWMRKVRPGGLRVVLETRRPVPLHPFVFAGDEVVDLRDVHGRGFASPRGRRGHARGGRDRGRPRKSSINFVQQNIRLIDEIQAREHLPCIFFLFSRDFCEKMAISCMSRDLVTDEERQRLVAHWEELRRSFEIAGDPTAERLGKLLVRGIAYHHAGMLPTLKEVVERLFTSGLIKLLFATETFSLGINMPARAVAFESLKKFDGVKRDYMKTREFLQMAGRAGRRGQDQEGFVYACVQPDQERPADVRRVMQGEVEAVESQFNLSYATLLSLYSHLGEGIFKAVEQSFVHFCHKRRKGAPFMDMLSQVKRRIRLLQEAGYLHGQELTPKGRFASLIYGYEIQAAELWAGGLLRQLGPHELALLVTALAYEAKRDTWFVPLQRDIQEPLRRAARDLIDPFRERELQAGIATITKRPDWNLARATWEWTHEAPFDSLGEWADVSPGDMVRCFRMGIQILRQLAKPLRFIAEDTTGFKKRLREAARLMKRGEVDAERQLRQAVQVEAGDEAAARIPAEVDVDDETAEGDVELRHVLAERPAGPASIEVELEGVSPVEAEYQPPLDDGLTPRGEDPSESELAHPRHSPGESPARPLRRPSAGDFGWLPPDEAGDHVPAPARPPRPDSPAR
ncbi:MAG TPA: DEAD/DEAH box helicase, partial [Planctomycetota bacterium]|nr:DEAD/DEAH box helicase [Planctomycetota bacterium]